MKLVIGSRGSKLALVQARMVAQRLSGARPGLDLDFRAVRTTGDRDRRRSLDEIGGQGVFVKELEQSLLQGSIDVAVHSLKDVPAQVSAGLRLAAVLPRDDPRDVLVSAGRESLARLPAAALVGTDSRRRVAQLRAVRPDLIACPIRGNIDTRLRKVREGQVSAVILAAAALLRLGLEDQVAEYLSTDVFLPAPGQGAIVLEIRTGEPGLDDLTSVVNDAGTWHAVLAERAFLRALGGGCRAPIAALGRVAGGLLVLDGMVASEDCSAIRRGRRAGPPGAAEELGRALALSIIAARSLSPAAEAGEARAAG